MAFSVPLAILFVTAVSKTILRVMTRLGGYQSRSEEVYAAAVNMWLIAFITTGLMV